MEHGGRIILLRSRIDLRIVGIHFQPGLPTRKSPMGPVVPLKRGPAIVSRRQLLILYKGIHIPATVLYTLIYLPGLDVLVVFDVLEFNIDHAYLVSVVNKWGGPHGE